MLPIDPFDPALCIGTVIEVGPMTVRAKLPDATPPEANWRDGSRFHGGKVGDFVIVELDDAAFFGRIARRHSAERPPRRVQAAPFPAV
jgi:hypothetical protein